MKLFFKQGINMLIPTVIDNHQGSQRAYDIYSRLLKDRIVVLSSEVNDSVASSIIAQLLYLDNQDSEEDITFYINSPGGAVTAGLGIMDTMNLVKADVSTICIGQAASMGALLLSAGAKGKRFALPNSRILIHQPLGGARGQASDIEIAANEILRLKKKLNMILAENTGQNLETITNDTDRDNILEPEQAMGYGIIDSIIHNK
jgi:ATP-dependent Clp protease protease subunit